MVLQVALRPEALVAPRELAYEGPLVTVDHQVRPQILTLAEGAGTPFCRAFERLGSIVKVHVCFPTHLSAEGLHAPGISAREAFDAHCLGLGPGLYTSTCIGLLGGLFRAGGSGRKVFEGFFFISSRAKE